ncbi:sensor histidine kinase [Longimicrobium sp.]|jgi:signal transduction histidine kinase|uniref:sensor histidine kinase n=1 Tax=Longimicrobium sp. TaxID=2029185 RepID=UPI002EDB457C
MRGLPLRAKIFFLFAATSLLIVVPALLLIARAVERGVYERARDDLDGAMLSVQQAWDTRDLLLAEAARARALDADLARAWQAGNMREVQRIIQLGLEKDVRPFVIDSTGRFILGPQIDAGPVAGAGQGRTTIAFPAKGDPVRFALEEVLADTVRLGRVGVGTRFSAASLKKQLNRTTEVVLLVGDSLIGTTLSDTAEAALNRGELLALKGSAAPVPRQIYAGQAYMARPLNLASRGLPATAILLRPITQELQVASAIKSSLWGIGFAALVLALVLAAVIARIVARPTQALAEASARMARGDFAAPLPRAGTDEIGQLARAFGEMRRAIADREGRLRSAQAEMIHREKLAAMGRLVAQLSHEINNPIYNIQNCLEALERRGDPNDPNREFLTLAQEELSRMASLTRRLLDQSRPQSDASSLLNLNALVTRVLTLAGPEIRERGVELRADLAPDLPPVVAHPEAIQQVLANLVANASDAMPGGGRLRVATRAVDEAVEVVVEDTGQGIAERDLPHIFEAFYTTKPAVTGIGLGLFVSEGIIRGHRGRIDVESTPGQGSRFIVRLPRETLDESLSDANQDAAVEARETAGV